MSGSETGSVRGGRSSVRSRFRRGPAVPRTVARMQVRRVLPAAVLAVLLAVAAQPAWPHLAAAASPAAPTPAPGTLKLDPLPLTVPPGQTFTVNVIQSAPVPTTGAQVNVTFLPKLVQLKDFELGPAYTAASAIFAFGNADLGTSGKKDATLARANSFGLLQNVAGFLLPGNGTIPAGDNVFLTLTFVAQPGAGGQMTLGLGNGSMIDQSGQPLDTQWSFGTLTVKPGAPPVASPSPSASLGAGPGPIASAVGPAPSSPATPVKVSLAPRSLTLKSGDQARIFFIAAADGNLTSISADLTFDNTKLQVLSVDPGPAWSGATVIAVSSGQGRGVDAAIAEANGSGRLQQAGVFFAPNRLDLPSGQSVFVSVLVKARADGTSSLSLANASALGVAGETLRVAVDASSLMKAPAKGFEVDPVLVGLIVVLLVLVLGGLVLARTQRIPVRVRRRWPYYVSLLLGLIPVLLFAGLVVTLLVNSAAVIDKPGLSALLGSSYITQYSATGNVGGAGTHFGLLPAVWGTVLIALIAVAVALPISLALAIVAVDFPMGPVSRLVRPLVAVLSGIPPIVYAVSAPAFVTLFMIPKFAADSTDVTFHPASIGANPATWPPAGVPYSSGGFPWSQGLAQNSTLLGGLLIALFLIPFVTPLFVDAMRDVPRAAREASLALGANVTYTLRRVVLPRALPAIVGASLLGALKALGDSIIVIIVVSWTAERLPNPLFDVLERTASLAGQAAGAIGGFETPDSTCSDAGCAVGYTTALLLLLIAGVVVIAVTYLQARGRRRVAV